MKINNEYRTSADLEKFSEKGEYIDIFTDYKEQKDFEGRAKLISRKTKGLTFMLHNENLFTRLEDRIIDHKTGAHIELTREQKLSNINFIKLKTLLTGVKKSGVHHVDINLYKLFNKLKKKATKDLTSPNELYNIIESYKEKWKACSDIRLELLSYPTETIVRFIQQFCIAKWCYSIWREESWLVEFEQDYYGGTPFRTFRKIRTLICVSPDEEAQSSEIVYYVTKENSMLNKDDYKERRELKALGLDEDDDDGEELGSLALDEDDDAYYKDEDDSFIDEDIHDIYQSKRIISLDTIDEETLDKEFYNDYDEE